MLMWMVGFHVSLSPHNLPLVIVSKKCLQQVLLIPEGTIAKMAARIWKRNEDIMKVDEDTASNPGQNFKYKVYDVASKKDAMS